MGTYIALADLQEHLSSGVVNRLLDDDNDGTADTASVNRLIQNAESTVEGYIRGNYDLATVRTSKPEQVKRLCLEFAHAELAIRHSENFTIDGLELRRQILGELRDLRTGKIRLDVTGTPEPAANQGGVVLSGDPDSTDPPDRFFGEGSTGTGDF